MRQGSFGGNTSSAWLRGVSPSLVNKQQRADEVWLAQGCSDGSPALLGVWGPTCSAFLFSSYHSHF